MNDLLSADLAVRDLHARYTDAVFRKDFVAFAECFTHDGEWRIAGRVFRGRPQIAEGIAAILSRLARVLITFRTPILAWQEDGLVGRTYIDEHCAWLDGQTNINIGRYYERFAPEDGRLRFTWRLFELHYRGPPDLTGQFFDHADYGPPPAMPPRDAATQDIPARA